MQLKQLMTLTEFTAELSVSRASIYREAAEGRLRLTKVRRRSYITQADALKWIDSLPKKQDFKAALSNSVSESSTSAQRGRK